MTLESTIQSSSTTMSGNGKYDPPKLSRSLAYKMREDGKTEVYDLDFAAYCLIRNSEIGVMDEVDGGRPGEYFFLFDDPHGLIAKHSIDYTNSESARHADAVRRLKKAIRSTRVRRG